MAIVTGEQPLTGRRCDRCGAFAPNGLLCPLHTEQAAEYTRHLRGVSKFEMLRVSTLSVDPRFQRPLHEGLLKRITNQFNEWDLGVLTVSRRAHELVLLDGQQRWAALTRMGYAEAPCIVYDGLDYSQEVMIFVVLNEQRVPVRQAVLFNNKAEAGITSYVEARQILHAFGYQLNDAGPRTRVAVGMLSCPATIETVHHMGKLASVLGVIHNAWPEEADANRAEVVMGLAAFLVIHPHIGTRELAEQLSRFRAVELVNAAAAMTKTSIDHRRWAHFFHAAVERYNYGKSQRRLPKMDVPNSAPRIWFKRNGG